MKVFVLCLCIWISLFADPIGNPSLPYLINEGFVIPDTTWCNPQCGFIGDFLIHKQLRKKHGDLRKGFLSGVSSSATAAWSIRERFNLQLRLGSGNYNWGWQQKNLNMRGFAKGGLLWSGDAKLILFNVEDTLIALDGQAGGWDWMDGSSTSNGIAAAKNAKTALRFWQIGGAITQRVSLFSPYIGFAVQHMRLKVSNLLTKTGRLCQRHQIGPFGGCSITYGSTLLLNVEFRSWFEEGVSVTGQFRF